MILRGQVDFLARSQSPTAYRRSVPPLALRATAPVSGEFVLKGSHPLHSHVLTLPGSIFLIGVGADIESAPTPT